MALREVIPRADLVTIHSINLFPQYAAFTTALKAGVPYIVTPHGALDPWLSRNSPTIKRVMNATWQGKMLTNAAAVHFTTTEEAELAAGMIGSAPPMIIPNGLDLKKFESVRPRRAFREHRLHGHDGPVILFIGRIAPKKGIDLLMRSFAMVRPPDGLLVIAGPDDDGIQLRLEQLAAQLHIQDSVRFVGPVYGTDQLDALAAADIWALTSHTENFGNAVVEAMAAGCPVLVSTEVNIARQVADAHAGVVTTLDVEEIAGALRSLLADPDYRADLSARARAFARRFDWSIIAPELALAFRRVAQLSDPISSSTT